MTGAREHEVEDHKIWAKAADQAQSRLSIGCDIGACSPRASDGGHRLSELGLVLDDQNLCHPVTHTILARYTRWGY